MNRFILVSVLWVFTGNAFAQGCWSTHEIAELEGFNELEGKLILNLKDAVDCQPVTNANVMIEDKLYQSDAAGNVDLTDIGFGAMSENMDMQISHQKYATYTNYLRFEAGTVIKRRFLLSKKMDIGNWRFVLSWSNKPKDLDLHLKSDDFHVSYRAKNSSDVAKLDRDALNGFGPETITLSKTKMGKHYQLYVNNFSGKPSFNNYASVDVYQGSSLKHSLQLPKTSSKNVIIGEIIDHQFIANVKPFNP